MGALSDSMRDAVIERITELEKRNIIDAMLFDAEEFKVAISVVSSGHWPRYANRYSCALLIRQNIRFCICTIS